MVLEIGCGTGEFLCNLASQRQDLNCLGVDVSIKPLYKAVASASSLGLDNVRFIHADIKLTYPLWGHQSLHAVILHFPVPNMRGRYRKKRVFDQSFLDAVHHGLEVGGFLSVKTDNQDYFSEMEKMVARDSRFEAVPGDQLIFSRQERFISPSQRVWETRGRPTLHFEIRKL
jgi:tRNA (guanine-N7-)-methyltransferase